MNQENITRTLATGQSDITRHEAYTKVTGLNEFNSLTPSYTNEEDKPTLDQMLDIVKKYIPDAQHIILYRPAVSDIYGLTSAFIGVAVEHNYNPEDDFIPEELYEYCLIEADGTQKAHILMNCSIDPDMPAGHTMTTYEMILAQCTGRLYIQSETIQADIKKIPTNDFTKLWDLSVNLIDTNMELYFKEATS